MAKTPGMLAEQKSFVKDESYESGFEIVRTFTNKLIENTIGEEPLPSLTILRNSNQRYRIEDYCTEVMIKSDNEGNLIAEFYCNNYKNTASNSAELSEDFYKKLESSFLLKDFTDIQAFNVVRSTATRNAIDHAYKILHYKSLNKLYKGFVVKYSVEELT